jgi:DNA-binding GntR family transcriptional regulator
VDKTDPPSLPDQTYTTLCERIVNGELRPGQRIVERELAENLGVSRVPVREALRRLQAEGLVLVVPRQGALVSPFTPADVDDLFDVRESLEELAARRAAGRADPQALDRMRAVLADAHSAQRRGDAPEFARLNAAFHDEIVEASGNALLQAMMKPLVNRLRWLFRLTAERDESQQCAEHAELFTAISEGKVQRAGELARRHVAEGRAPSLQMAANWASEEWGTTDFDPVAATRTRRRRGQG